MASGLFEVIYGTVRCCIGYVRLPDEEVGYLPGGWFTIGQALSFPIIVGGVALIVFAYRGGAASRSLAIA
ncbi:MAG: prolipoprotein diacylglyceryl transferase family protein [Gammaproteobacteria bacterium]